MSNLGALRFRENGRPQFGGSGVGNFGNAVAEKNGWNGLPTSAVRSLPLPLGAPWPSTSADK